MSAQAITMEQAAALLGLPKPVHHRQRACADDPEAVALLVDVTPSPERQQETELEFYKRKAAERAKALHESERRRRLLELRILELLEEAES